MKMLLTCDSCRSFFRLDESLLAGARMARIRCRTCGEIIVVQRMVGPQKRVEAPPPPPPVQATLPEPVPSGWVRVLKRVMEAPPPKESLRAHASRRMLAPPARQAPFREPPTPPPPEAPPLELPIPGPERIPDPESASGLAPLLEQALLPEPEFSPEPTPQLGQGALPESEPSVEWATPSDLAMSPEPAPAFGQPPPEPEQMLAAEPLLELDSLPDQAHLSEPAPEPEQAALLETPPLDLPPPEPEGIRAPEPPRQESEPSVEWAPPSDLAMPQETAPWLEQAPPEPFVELAPPPEPVPPSMPESMEEPALFLEPEAPLELPSPPESAQWAAAALPETPPPSAPEPEQRHEPEPELPVLLEADRLPDEAPGPERIPDPLLESAQWVEPAAPAETPPPSAPEPELPILLEADRLPDEAPGEPTAEVKVYHRVEDLFMPRDDVAPAPPNFYFPITKSHAHLITLVAVFLSILAAAAAAYILFSLKPFRTMPAKAPAFSGNSAAGKPAYEIRDAEGHLNRSTTGQVFFVVRGTVENVGEGRSDGIRVRASLLGTDNAVVMVGGSFAGNLIDENLIPHMPRVRVEEFLGMRYGEGNSNRNIPKGGSLPFMVVFFNPPGPIGSFSVTAVDVEEPSGR
jgi:predicted Zn finger-like uncharacterized protein